MNHAKGSTEKRILKIVNFKKPSFMLITLAIVISLIIGIVALTNGIDKDSQTAAGLTDEEPDKTTGTEVDEEMAEAFEKLCINVLEGYSQADTKEKLPDEYNYIISKGDMAVEFLKAQIADIADNKSGSGIDDEPNGKSGNEPDDNSGDKPDDKIDDETYELSLVRRKITAEWLISDIFKMRSGEEFKNYRKEDSTVVLTRDCIGRTGPGDSFGEWCRIPENTIIRITGVLNTDWWTAKKIPPLTLTETLLESDSGLDSDSSSGSDSDSDPDPQGSNTFDSFFKTDCVEFWINRQDFESHLVHDEPLSFSLTRTYDAEEYKWVIQTGKKSVKLYDPDNSIEMFDSPGADKSIVGYALNNELIRIKKNGNGNIIGHDGWVLIERFPFNPFEGTTIGWVEDKYVVDLPEETDEIQPMQGFILRNTLIYREPSMSSETWNDYYPELKSLKYSPVLCIHILDARGDWLRVSPGLNSFSGWIHKDNVFYRFTEEIKNEIYHPEPDLDTFVSKLQEEIRNNSSFIIKAEDTNDVFKPTAEQRKALAASVKKVLEPVMWNGGITDYREAAYPFYRLEFDVDSMIVDMLTLYNTTANNNADNTKYSMVITAENKLLLMMDRYTCYDYGIGRMGPPVKFITPNIEFIEKIKELFPAEPNNSPDNISYLLNAQKLRFKGAYSPEGDVTLQVQINKCVRAIKNAMGEEIPENMIAENSNGKSIDNEKDDGISNGDNKDTGDEPVEKKYLFEFEFTDGSIIVVTYTDNYIEYNGKYYVTLEKPYNLIAGLFAAYF